MKTKREKKTNAWWKSQQADPYVKAARQDGYRSRAAYKLLEIQERVRLLQPGDVILDLGAAPGGWSQVASRVAGSKGLVIAVDRTPVLPIEGVHLLQADLLHNDVGSAVNMILGDRRPNVVLSDLAPNITGISIADQARCLEWTEVLVNLANQWLTKGRFLMKGFQGIAFEEVRTLLRTHFEKVTIIKPRASRMASREIYFFATR